MLPRVRWLRPVLWLIVVGLLAAVLLPSPAGANEAKIQELQRKIQQFQNQMNEAERQKANTQQRLGSLRGQEASLKGDVAQLENEIDDVEAELIRLRAQLAAAQKRLEEAEAQLADAEEELDYRRELLQRRVQVIYERGPVSYLEVLLTSTSFQDFLQRFHALRLVVGKDSELFGEAEELWEEVKAKRAAVEAERQAIAQRQEQVAARRQQMEVMIAQREQKLSQVQGDAAELARLLDEQDRLSAEIGRQLRSLQNELAQYGTISGGFAFNPLAGSLRVTSNFGPRFHPVLRTNRAHNGIDLGAPTGTNILAVAPGVVTYAGTLGGYGNTVMIMHGSDERGRQLVTLYAHASRLYVRSGEEVQGGQTIAAVGMTGVATGPHLHFEVRLNGTPVNPAPYLTLR